MAELRWSRVVLSRRWRAAAHQAPTPSSRRRHQRPGVTLAAQQSMFFSHVNAIGRRHAATAWQGVVEQAPAAPANRAREKY